MELIQFCFKACYTVKSHIILQAAFLLLQIIMYDGHWPTEFWCKYHMAEFSFKHSWKSTQSWVLLHLTAKHANHYSLLVRLFSPTGLKNILHDSVRIFLSIKSSVFQPDYGCGALNFSGYFPSNEDVFPIAKSEVTLFVRYQCGGFFAAV